MLLQTKGQVHYLQSLPKIEKTSPSVTRPSATMIWIIKDKQSLFSERKDFKYVWHLGVKKLWEIQVYDYAS